MFPQRYEPYLFGLLLSGLMSLIVSGVATLRAAGIEADFIRLWISNWLAAWLIAFPVVLVAAPAVRQMARGLIREE